MKIFTAETMEATSPWTYKPSAVYVETVQRLQKALDGYDVVLPVYRPEMGINRVTFQKGGESVSVFDASRGAGPRFCEAYVTGIIELHTLVRGICEEAGSRYVNDGVDTV